MGLDFLCGGTTKSRPKRSRSRSQRQSSGTTHRARGDYHNYYSYHRNDPEGYDRQTDYPVHQDDQESTYPRHNGGTQGTRRPRYADDQDTPPPRQTRPSSESRPQRRSGDHRLRPQGPSGAQEPRSHRRSGEQDSRPHRRSDEQESRSHRRSGDRDRQSRVYGTSALPRTGPARSSSQHRKSLRDDELPARPRRPTGPRPTYQRSGGQRPPITTYTVPTRGTTSAPAPPSSQTQTKAPRSTYDSEGRRLPEVAPLWGNTAKVAEPQVELKVPVAPEPVFVSPTTTAAARAANDTGRSFSDRSEYTVPDPDLEILSLAYWTEELGHAERVLLRKATQFDLLNTYIRCPFVKTYLSELNPAQRDELVRVKLGSEKGVAVRLSADNATTLMKCETFLKEIEEGDYRAGQYMSNRLSLKGQREAFEMSQRDRMLFYDSARKFRKDKSASSISAIEAGPHFMASSQRERQEYEATRPVRHKYGVRYLSRTITNWPNQ